MILQNITLLKRCEQIRTELLKVQHVSSVDIKVEDKTSIGLFNKRHYRTIAITIEVDTFFLNKMDEYRQTMTGVAKVLRVPLKKEMTTNGHVNLVVQDQLDEQTLFTIRTKIYLSSHGDKINILSHLFNCDIDSKEEPHTYKYTTYTCKV